MFSSSAVLHKGFKLYIFPSLYKTNLEAFSGNSMNYSCSPLQDTSYIAHGLKLCIDFQDGKHIHGKKPTIFNFIPFSTRREERGQARKHHFLIAPLIISMKAINFFCLTSERLQRNIISYHPSFWYFALTLAALLPARHLEFMVRIVNASNLLCMDNYN